MRTETALHQPQVHACAIAPDGSFVAVGGWGSPSAIRLKIWNIAARADPTPAVGASGVRGCAFSRDGEYLIVAAGRDLEIWDPLTAERVAALRGHDSEVLACSASPNGAFIVSASADATLKVWNVPGDSSTWPTAPAPGRASDCAVAPDGSFVVVTGTDGSIRVLDGTTGQERRVLGRFDRLPQSGTCAVSPDGTSVIAGTWGEDTTGLTMWDVATGAALLDLPHDYLRVAAFSPDGSRILSMNRVLKLWDARTGRLLGNSWDGPIADRFALSPDWSFVVSAGGGPTDVMVWDLETGKERAQLSGHTDLVFACAVSPDGSWFASAGGDATVRVWETQSKRALATLEGHAGPIGQLAVAPDGSFLVSGSMDRTVRIWDASTWQERGSLQGEGGVSGLAISPDCSLVVSWSHEGTLQVCDARTCAAVAMMPLRVSRVAVHPAAPSLVACDMAGHLRLLALRGVAFGALVIAALDAGDGPTIRCPACHTVVPLERAWLGHETACSSCGQQLRINPSVVKPFRRPWHRRWARR